jgi:inner membrane protein involved in colicin E2 resistance
MRLFYDSMYIPVRKRGKEIWDIPHKTIEEYSFKADRQNKRFIRNLNKKTVTDNSNQQGCWNSIRKYITSIYEWDNKFRYTTIVICTYTVAYIFLFHLTGTVILLYNTQTNSYIQYIKDIFKVMLHIGMYIRIFLDQFFF